VPSERNDLTGDTCADRTFTRPVLLRRKGDDVTINKRTAIAVALTLLASPVRPVPTVQGVPPRTPWNCGKLTSQPVLLAVLGDGFTKDEENLLKIASSEKVCDGAFLQDRALKSLPLYAETVVVTSPTNTIGTTPAQASQTALEVVYNGSRRDCFFTTSADSMKKIVDAASNAIHKQIVVIVNIGDQEVRVTGTKIVLQAGGGSITIDATGVTVVGTIVKIN